MESEYTGAYAEFEDDRFLYLKYRFQPLEDDAFRYGQEKIESFQNIYKNDKAYQVYWERVYKLNENDIGNALELLRADYQEKIDRGIIADYQSRYGMNHLNENNNLYIKQYALEKTPLCNEQRNALQNDDFGIQKSNNSIKMD